MLEFVSVASHPEYVAPKMLSFLKSHELTDKIQVAQIDPQYADGEKLSETYGVDINQELNCLAFAGKRDGQIRYAASWFFMASELILEQFSSTPWMPPSIICQFGRCYCHDLYGIWQHYSRWIAR